MIPTLQFNNNKGGNKAGVVRKRVRPPGDTQNTALFAQRAKKIEITTSRSNNKMDESDVDSDSLVKISVNKKEDKLFESADSKSSSVEDSGIDSPPKQGNWAPIAQNDENPVQHGRGESGTTEPVNAGQQAELQTITTNSADINTNIDNNTPPTQDTTDQTVTSSHKVRRRRTRSTNEVREEQPDPEQDSKLVPEQAPDVHHGHRRRRKNHNLEKLEPDNAQQPQPDDKPVLEPVAKVQEPEPQNTVAGIQIPQQAKPNQMQLNSSRMANLQNTQKGEPEEDHSSGSLPGNEKSAVFPETDEKCGEGGIIVNTENKKLQPVKTSPPDPKQVNLNSFNVLVNKSVFRKSYTVTIQENIIYELRIDKYNGKKAVFIRKIDTNENVGYVTIQDMRRRFTLRSTTNSLTEYFGCSFVRPKVGDPTARQLSFVIAPEGWIPSNKEMSLSRLARRIHSNIHTEYDASQLIHMTTLLPKLTQDGKLILNFAGNFVVSSVKNFVVHDSNDEIVLLLFKQSKELLVCQYKAPFTEVYAIAFTVSVLEGTLSP